MADLSRPASRPSPPRERALVIREPLRLVRPDDAVARAALRLALVATSAAGAILGVWTLGYIGFRLGVAPILGVPELRAEPGEGLATGVLLALRAPLTIYRAALAEPLWLVVGFVLIAIPAAALPAARPLVRGAPGPGRTTAVFASLGAAAAMVLAAAEVAWIVSPLRTSRLGPIPSAADAADAWVRGLSIVAGADLLVAAAAALWAILVLRLPVATWLRWLAGSFVYFGLAVVLVGTAVSGAAAVHIDADRAVVVAAGATGPEEGLLLGYTRGHAALLRVVDGTPLVELADPARPLVVIGRESVAERLRRD